MVTRNGPWQTMSSHVVYENDWLRLRHDEVVRPDGERGIYGVVEFPGSVAILAVNRAGAAALVSQWRYPLRRESLELPTGAIDPTDDSPLAAAQRELLEEAGWHADEWHSLGSIDNCNGATNDTTHLFLAWQASPADDSILSAEDAATLSRTTVPLSELRRDVLGGKITAAPSVAAVLHALEHARSPVAEHWSQIRDWFHANDTG